MSDTKTTITSENRFKFARKLKETTLFKQVEMQDLDALVVAMKPVAYSAGEVLFKQGDQGDSMFLIQSGKIRIYSHDDDGNELTLAEYGESRIFGDFALFDEQPRSASAAAMEPSELLVLTRAELLTFLPIHTTLGTAMLNHLTDRLRHITRYLNQVTTFGQRLAAGETDKALKEIEEVNPEEHDDIKGLMVQFKDIAYKVKERADQTDIE
jgi:CRP/FNR family transcriptional regulator, cyclic AMP receptor protein